MPFKDPQKRKAYNQKYHKENYQDKREEILDSSKKYYESHKEEKIAKQKERLETPEGKEKRHEYIVGYRAREKEVLSRKRHGYHLRAKYSISLEEYEKILKAQENKCALCGQVFEPKRRPDVDHCHATGKIRGLLHLNCNTLLGHAKDNLELLAKAMQYLQTHAKPL